MDELNPHETLSHLETDIRLCECLLYEFVAVIFHIFQSN